MTSHCPLTVIGVVRSDRATPDTTPVQSSLNRHEEGSVEVAEPYVDGLTGLDGFDYLWLVTWLGRPDSAVSATPPMVQVPFLLRPQGRPMGVFATRGPRRVNPIGLSLVRLVAIDGAVIRFAGVDLVDGTPVVDIKPYVAQFDHPPGAPRSGWFDDVPMPEAVTPQDL
jgi:tRNA-Thr(GGU) m(6)t(6)A37 methyltransferase TsaA